MFRRRSTRFDRAILLALGCASWACDGDDPAPLADLRADVDRDGAVTLAGAADDTDEDVWTPERGAVVLANLDDDERRCARDAALAGVALQDLPDAELASCNDAADAVVNGDADVADLARIVARPWRHAPRGAVGTVSVTPPERGRLFRLDQADRAALGPQDELGRDDLRAGLELGLEALDVVRDPETWDGTLEVALSVTASGETSTDRVRFRVAPLVLNHHLQAPIAALVASLSAAGTVAYRADLTAAVVAAGFADGLLLITGRGNDQWAQDHYEAGWMSVPGPAGPQGMTVFLRTPHVDYFDDPLSPLRRAGRAVFEDFRGLDFAGLQQYEPGGTEDQQTLNSFGNLEVVPPFEHEGRAFPFGRQLIGMTAEFAPDPSYLELLAAQGVQPRIELDTSWLSVAHVDETLSFVPVDSPRGWAVVVADVGMTLDLFDAWVAGGHGEVELFTGLDWYDLTDFTPYSATTTVAAVLDDVEVMTASAAAEVETANQLAVLEREVGITEADIIRVPSLHFRSLGASVGYLPAPANLVELGRGHVAVADPHGPVIDGEDALRAATIAAFAPHGITVHFVEDWDSFHRLNGDAHCGSNVLRARPEEEGFWTAME